MFLVKGFANQRTKLEADQEIWLKIYEDVRFGRSFSKSTRIAFCKLKMAVNQFLEGCHEVVPLNRPRELCFTETKHLNVLELVYHEADADFRKRKFLDSFRTFFVCSRLKPLFEVSVQIVQILDEQENRNVVNIIHTFSIAFAIYEVLLSNVQFYEAISEKFDKRSKTLVQN